MTSQPNDDINLTPVEIETLILLLERGDDLPANIADQIGRHRKSVSRKLKALADRDLVRAKGSGVYSLTPYGILLAQALRRQRERLQKNEDEDESEEN